MPPPRRTLPPLPLPKPKPPSPTPTATPTAIPTPQAAEPEASSPPPRRRSNPFTEPVPFVAEPYVDHVSAQVPRIRRGTPWGLYISVAVVGVLVGYVTWRMIMPPMSQPALVADVAPPTPHTPPPAVAPNMTTPALTTNTPPAPAPAPTAAKNGCPADSARLGSGRACIDLYEYPGRGQLPRVNVTFAQAETLCAARHERLCEAAEWENGCRGDNGASYPWGQSFDNRHCNVVTASGAANKLAASGSRATCRSASGAYDMSGNAAEWVIARGAPAHKGGSVGSPAGESRCSHTERVDATATSGEVGFRCCATVR